VQQAVRRASDDVPDVSIRRTSGATTSMVMSSRSAYRALHAMLWAPIERWLPQEPDARITIVPHGPLFALPFGALLDRGGRYVVERYALHYAPSGTVLAEAVSHQRASQSGARELVVADPQPLPRLAAGVRLPALTAARAEARAIASLFASNADLLVGGRATESAVRAGLGGARVVHFATHAIVSDSDPLGSHLMLSTGGTGILAPERDGRLTASEVAGLSLSADLVVLGACRSARGPVSSDGIAGLTRAFMTAGAPSVVATLWDVSDQTTARVMTQFYAGYVAGLSKDRALRAAQLTLLGDLRAGKVRRTIGKTSLTYAEHPHLWAGTILTGAP
jgi:CHAT domain-containing protein